MGSWQLAIGKALEKLITVPNVERFFFMGIFSNFF
jgi:hypothetical protein